MNNGFTLLELLIVIIIISILASVGFSRYGDMVERGRASEARYICARIRDAEEMYFVENGKFTRDIARLNIGDIPHADAASPYDCASSNTNFLQYDIDTWSAENRYNIEAFRCRSGGKPPSASTGYKLILYVDRDASASWWGDFPGET